MVRLEAKPSRDALGVAATSAAVYAALVVIFFDAHVHPQISKLPGRDRGP
jgi:hypothetical protein